MVDERNRSWCSSSEANDQRAVTIECASDKTEPYAFNSTVYNKLIELCVDICRRNGKNKLVWISDKNKALAYNPAVNEMLLTVHRWFANKSCPGDWMYSRMGELAQKVNEKLGSAGDNTVGSSGSKIASAPTQTSSSYVVRITTRVLNVRKGPGTNYGITTQVKKGEVYTIVAEKKNGNTTWGKLKSGAGYISLGYTERV